MASVEVPAQSTSEAPEVPPATATSVPSTENQEKTTSPSELQTQSEQPSAGEAGSESPKNAFPTTTTGKIEHAKKLKEEGNAFFKEGNIKKACRQYRTVFAFVNGLHGAKSSYAQYTNQDDQLSKEQEEEIIALKTTVYCNLAVCYLKIGEVEKAETAGAKAVEVSPESSKALFRHGQALLKAGNLDKAKSALLKAAKLDPQNKAIRKELNVWKAANAEQLKKKKEAEKKIFGGKFN